MKYLLTAILALLNLCAQASTVTLPKLVSDGMVLQRDQPVPVWGWATEGETVTVTFRKKTYTAVAGKDGRWQVTLPKQKAGGPYTLTVNDRTINDVLVGDVWLCSGQSNMDVQVERVAPQYAAETFDYANDKIRLLRVRNTTNTHAPQTEVPTDGWKHLSRETAWNFSAVGYFLSREMFERTRVPQGVIVNSWGGTPIEAWIDADRMQKHYPQAYEETVFYQDDAMVKAVSEAGNALSTRWQALLDSRDQGICHTWQMPATPDRDWQKVSQDGNLLSPLGGQGGASQLIGSLWLRQHITVDKAHAGKPATLLLGTLYDCDYTYLNGKEIGRTYYQYPPRRYAVPEGALKEGDNVIAVRFVNKGGVPSFVKGKPYRLDFGGGDTLALSHEWLAKVGAQVMRAPSAGVALQNLPSTLYNAVLAPLAPYAVAGAVWYQGESNTGRPGLYLDQLRLLKDSWRERWQRPDMPFVIVQLANYMQPSKEPQESGWAELREAQRLAAAEDPRAELAVAIDLGEGNDIHPLRKWELSKRIATALERQSYGKKVTLSPQPVSVKAEPGSIVVTFDQSIVFTAPPTPRGGELELPSCALSPLGGMGGAWELSADGRHYYNAQAVAKGNTVTVTCGSVRQPLYVRHGWKHNPDRLNTRGLNGYPATPFQAKAETAANASSER